MRSGIPIAALMATAAFVPAAMSQENQQQTQDGQQLIAVCQEMMTYVQENDTEGTGMTMERAETIARANEAQYCEDGLRLAQGEITDQEGAENYDADAAARLTVAVPEPEVQVTQTAPDVTVEQQPPQVQVDPGQPTVIVEQAQPTVRVLMQPPQITIDMPKPRILVEMPDPTVTVALQEPRVSVEQDQPRVEVTQGEPQIEINEQDIAASEQEGEPQVQVDQEQATVRLVQPGEAEVSVSEVRPNVQYNAAEPQIEVEQAGEPQIEFNQSGEADVQFRQMSADETRQRANEAQQAQAQQPEEQQQAQAGQEPMEGARMSVVEPGADRTATAGLETSTLSIDRLLEMHVVGMDGETIGDVEDVVFRGEEAFVIVGQGGFLGLGETQVALPLSDTLLVGEDELVMREITAEETEQMREASSDEFTAFEPGREVEVNLQ